MVDWVLVRAEAYAALLDQYPFIKTTTNWVVSIVLALWTYLAESWLPIAIVSGLGGYIALSYLPIIISGNAKPSAETKTGTLSTQEESELEKKMVTVMENNELRFVFFKEADQWVAQCVEVDICVQAPDLDTLEARFDVLVEAELAYASKAGKEGFGDIGPAPEIFSKMWERGRRLESSSHKELKLCA